MNRKPPSSVGIPVVLPAPGLATLDGNGSYCKADLQRFAGTILASQNLQDKLYGAAVATDNGYGCAYAAPGAWP